jgi:hypothetical protein
MQVIRLALLPLLGLVPLACSVEERGGPGQGCFTDGTCATGLVCGHDTCCAAALPEGTFTAPVEIALAELPDLAALAALDLDRDGAQDLAAASSGSSRLGLLHARTRRGRPVGAFVPVDGVALAPGPKALLAADLDGDGALDLASASSGAGSGAGSVGVLRADGAGGLLPRVDFPVGEQTSCLAAGDLDRDGRLDLVAGNADGASGLRVLLNQGGGDFAALAGFSPNGRQGDTSALSLADLDGDGRLDLLAGTGNGSGSVYLLQGSGDGTFTDQAQPLNARGLETRALALGDLDCDGASDLAALIPANSSRLLLLRGLGAFEFQESGEVELDLDYAAARAMLLRDLDGDGHPDLVAALCRGEVGAIEVRRGTGSADSTAFGPAEGLPLAGCPAALQVEDLNGDGVPDLVVAGELPEGGGGAVWVLRGQAACQPGR